MTLPFLLVGGSEKVRKQKALERAEEYSDKFDTIFFDTNDKPTIVELRETVSKMHRRPFRSKYQSLIIHQAQNLSLEAQNTLLKTLEEPPTSAILILTAPSKESVLSTISSRCELHELASEDQKPVISKISSFMARGVMDKFKSLDSFDIDEWISYYRSLVVDKEKNYDAVFDKSQIKKEINYLKILIKAKNAVRKRASKKILKTFLVLETPSSKS